MKINNIVQNVPHTNSVKSDSIKLPQGKDFTAVLNIKQGQDQSIELPKNVNKEMIQDFAEWYFKQGRVYENTRSYKQAISAYEKANTVAPDISKSESIDSVRKKEYKG